jgi:hypothetical protein
MKKSRFSEEQITTALRQVDSGADPRSNRVLAFSEATYSGRRRRYGQITMAEIRLLRQFGGGESETQTACDQSDAR